MEQLLSHLHYSLLLPKSLAHKCHSFGHHKRSPILICAKLVLWGFSVTSALSQLSVAKSKIKHPAAQSFSFSMDKLWGNTSHEFQSPPFLAVGCCYASSSSWLKTVPTYSYAVHNVPAGVSVLWHNPSKCNLLPTTRSISSSCVAWRKTAIYLLIFLCAYVCRPACGWCFFSNSLLVLLFLYSSRWHLFETTLCKCCALPWRKQTLGPTLQLLFFSMLWIKLLLR